MRLSQGLAALVLLASASMAHAELTGNLTAVSDYNWRGISQSAGDPAIQGGIDWASDNGFYAGTWASNVDFGDEAGADIEVDLYAGFGGGEEVTWNVGAIYYWYPGADADLDFPEIYASLGWQFLTGKISYSNDFGNSSESAFYYEVNGSWELPANFGANAHFGYSDGDAIDLFYEDSYFDWSVGVTYGLGNFTLGLKYADGSDLDILDGFTDENNSEGVVIFSVGTTFPWGKE
jgi:uncharacterized protein (TIGR02001 family)